MIGATHLIRFYNDDYQYWVNAQWPEFDEELIKYYDLVEARNSYSRNSETELESLKEILERPSIHPMRLSCNSAKGTPIQNTAYSPVIDIFNIKQKVGDSFQITNNCFVTDIKKKGAIYVTNFIDLTSSKQDFIESDAIVLASNTIESTRIL